MSNGYHSMDNYGEERDMAELTVHREPAEHSFPAPAEYSFPAPAPPVPQQQNTETGTCIFCGYQYHSQGRIKVAQGP